MQYDTNHTNAEPRNRHERRALEAGHPRLAYSIGAFARAADIGRSKVYEEIRCGRLKAKKVGSRTIITVSDANDYFVRLPDLDSKAA